jgi:hypothetical protein
MAMDSGPTIRLFKICWADLSLLFSVNAPVSLGAGGILGVENIKIVGGNITDRGLELKNGILLNERSKN